MSKNGTLIYGKTASGHRYVMSSGLHCDECGGLLPDEECDHWEQQEYRCMACYTPRLEAAAILRNLSRDCADLQARCMLRRACEHAQYPHSVSEFVFVQLAGIELQRQALVRQAAHEAETEKHVIWRKK